MENFKSDQIEIGSSQYSFIPTGGIIMMSGPFSKYSISEYEAVGLLPCDGRSLSTTTYSNLYSVIGTSFGGSGSSFNIPNLTSTKYAPMGRMSEGIGSTNNSVAHSHNTNTTNTSMSMNAGNTDHDHTVSHGGLGNMYGENGHDHGFGGGSTNLDAAVSKYGAAGTAGGGLIGTHTHSAGINSNNAAGGGGNNHSHGGYVSGYMGYRSGGAVSHTHTANSNMPTATSGLSSIDNTFFPYQNVLYFIKI